MQRYDAARPTRCVIDLDALAFNFRSVRSFVGDTIKYLAVVKADAYGHGSIECSRRLEAEGIDWFGVALPEEGVELRDAGITSPILCLGSFWPGQESLMIEKNLTPVILTIDKARSLNAEAAKIGRIVDIHVKIDTGMGRVGVRYDKAEQFASEITKLPNLNIEGIMTHFAVADDLGQNDFTNQQISRFNWAVEAFKQYGSTPAYLDLANSPGAVAHTNTLGNMVRLGGVLYGLGGDVLPVEIEKPELKPVMSVVSEIAQVKSVETGESIGYGRTFIAGRDSVIASVPVGYYDGYPRGLSNQGSMIVKGKIAPVIGRVSMDWVTIDVTDIDDADVGTPVTVIGSERDLSIKAEDIAAMLSTISYEVTCGISARVPRIFKEKI
ncbi:MAG: alanine racemase [Pyrinomonadaceae bacterium]|nr:alanine racemase [Acidobacteriota bacterium]MBP7376023.1 alanine racemase [Pyrinomonadaceae bacterium]